MLDTKISTYIYAILYNHFPNIAKNLTLPIIILSIINKHLLYFITINVCGMALPKATHVQFSFLGKSDTISSYAI